MVIMKRLLAPVLILTATLATVSATTAQEVSPISLSSTVIVVGHGEPVIASVAPRTSCPGELAVAWYVPRDVTAALQDGNLVEVVTTPLHDGRATLTQDEVGEWLGQRLYGRVEGSSCTLLGWAQLDVAYV